MKTALIKALREPRKAVSVSVHKLLSPVGHRRYRHFVVLTRDRTGSNMLIQSLNSHPQISADYEVFAKLFGQSEEAILGRAFGKQPFFVKAKGFKIFYYHPQDKEESTVWKLLSEIEDLQVIHLKRRNILHALVSSRIAYTTGVYGVRSNEEQAKYARQIPSISYEKNKLEADFIETKRWESEGIDRFKSKPILELYYEDIAADLDSEFQRITEFLGLKYRKPKTDFRKQRTKDMREVLDNYDELKRSFKNTNWSVFFDE